MDTDSNSSEGLTIRQYKRSDAERVWAIHEAALRASQMEFVENTSADGDIMHISAEYLENEGEFLVGELDNDIVAIGGYRALAEDVAEIRRMRVHPDNQRHGFGAQLLAALENRAAEDGYERCVLVTHEDLNSAQNLYQAHDYVQSESESHPDTDEQLIQYQKEI